MKIALVAAPEAGQAALARMLPEKAPDGSPLMVVDKNWVVFLANMITKEPSYVDKAAFVNDLKSVTAAMGGYDYVFYIPIYAWNIVDNGENAIDEDSRIQLDFNIQKILNTCKVEYTTLPEAPAWDRAKFITDMIE